jgi:LPS-assembly lipoprotein
MRFAALAAALSLALACAGLSGCGFRPVYGSAGSMGGAAAQLSQVHIDTIPERNGQMLRNALIERMNVSGIPARPSHRLVIGLKEEELDLGIRRDATVTRGQIKMTATYELVDTATQAIVSRGTARSISSYNVVESDFGTFVSRGDAQSRALQDLGDDIALRIALYFNTRT